MTADDPSWPVLRGVSDAGPLELSPARWPVETRSHSFTCSSGREFGGTWRGIALSSVIDHAETPAATTHVVVEATDGYRLCLPVADALDAILAFERVDGPAEADDFPRLIAPSISGMETVKCVASVEAIELDPADEPEELSTLPPSVE